MMLPALLPGYSQEQAAPPASESKLEATANLVETAARLIGGKEKPATAPAAKEDEGFLGSLDGMIDIGKGMLSDKWTALKDQCAEIKELMVQTFFLVQLICIGVALFVSLVPLLLVVAVLYLRKINRRLESLAAGK